MFPQMLTLTVMHFLCFPFKIVFAIVVPPTAYGGGCAPAAGHDDARPGHDAAPPAAHGQGEADLRCGVPAVFRAGRGGARARDAAQGGGDRAGGAPRQGDAEEDGRDRLHGVRAGLNE